MPTVRHAIRNEQLAADNRLDRMTIWIRNVERVVEDARANFAAGSMTPLPPLPPHTFQGSRRAGTNEGALNGSTELRNGSQTNRPRRRTVGSPSSEIPTDKHSSTKNEESWDPSHPRSLSRPITPLINLQKEMNRGTK